MKIDLQSVVDGLDALSRTRALTLPESLTLERALKGLERNGGGSKRLSNRDAARLGIKRDVSRFGKAGK